MKKYASLLLIILFIFTFSGCDLFDSSSYSNNSNSASGSYQSNVSVQSISLNTTQLELKIGETYTLKATVQPSNASNKSVKWESTNSDVVNINNGIVNAKKIGRSTIKVISNENSSIYQMCDITVNGNYSVTITNNFPFSFYYEYAPYGVLVYNKTLKVNSVSYNLRTNIGVSQSSIVIFLTLVCQITQISGNTNSNYTLNYRVLDENNIEKVNGKILVSSSLNTVCEKTQSINIYYTSLPSSANLKLSFS